MQKSTTFLDWVKHLSSEDLRNNVKLVDESITLWKSWMYSMKIHKKVKHPLHRAHADPNCADCPIRLFTGGLSCSNTSFYDACYKNQYSNSGINSAANFILTELYEVCLVCVQVLCTKI